MDRWTFWDWAAYTSLFIAVIWLAIWEGIKRIPEAYMPDVLTLWIWPFLPAILVVVASLILIARGRGWLGRPPKEKFPKWPDSYKPVLVEGKRFMNQSVLLDGSFYSKCRFENVTFTYNGTTAVQFSNNEIAGRILFASDNNAVSGTFLLLYGMGLIPKETELIGLHPSNQVMPPAARERNAEKPSA